MATETKPLPCPRCNCAGEVLPVENASGWYFFAQCSNRECPVHGSTRHCKTKAEAIRLWNHRHTPDAVKDLAEAVRQYRLCSDSDQFRALMEAVEVVVYKESK